MTKTAKMKQIRDEIFTLKSSPLYEYRTSNNYFPVIGEGSHDAKIMFVGEARPERSEDRTAILRRSPARSWTSYLLTWNPAHLDLHY